MDERRVFGRSLTRPPLPHAPRRAASKAVIDPALGGAVGIQGVFTANFTNASFAAATNVTSSVGPAGPEVLEPRYIGTVEFYGILGQIGPLMALSTPAQPSSPVQVLVRLPPQPPGPPEPPAALDAGGALQVAGAYLITWNSLGEPEGEYLETWETTRERATPGSAQLAFELPPAAFGAGASEGGTGARTHTARFMLVVLPVTMPAAAPIAAGAQASAPSSGAARRLMASTSRLAALQEGEGPPCFGKGPLRHPMRPPYPLITSKFGNRVRNGTKEFHTGIDIRAARETQVVAAMDGTVASTVSTCEEGDRKCGGGYGNQVVIKGARGAVRYAHLETVLVQKDSHVKAGQVVGTTDNTGNSSGDHLHFEWLPDGTGPQSDPTPCFEYCQVECGDMCCVAENSYCKAPNVCSICSPALCGSQCCSPGELCDEGNGRCCSGANVCGDPPTCCMATGPEASMCVAGKCCPAKQACKDVCCNTAPGMYCGNYGANLCCTEPDTPCGAKLCCGLGSKCIGTEGSESCCPDSQTCGDEEVFAFKYCCKSDEVCAQHDTGSTKTRCCPKTRPFKCHDRCCQFGGTCMPKEAFCCEMEGVKGNWCVNPLGPSAWPQEFCCNTNEHCVISGTNAGPILTCCPIGMEWCVHQGVPDCMEPGDPRIWCCGLECLQKKSGTTAP